MSTTDHNCVHVPPVRRSPRMWLLMTLYALGGFIALASLLFQVVEFSILTGVVVLLFLSLLCPRVGRACIGAIVFTWAPLVLLLASWFAGVWGEVEPGYEMLVVAVISIFGVYATPVVVIIAGVSAVILGLMFPVQKTTPGHCTNCDYNLRGLTSDRCPECGAMIDDVGRGRVSTAHHAAFCRD